MAATSACSAAGRQFWISADRRAAGDVRARRRNLPARSAALLPPLRGWPYLGQIIREYLEHYHPERNHQGLDNRLLEPRAGPANDNGEVVRKQRLGGLLSFYESQAG